MRSFMKLVLSAALAAFPSAWASAATLNVHVRDGSGPVRYFNVAAINFGMNGPSTHTLLGVTDAQGNVQFTIQPQMSYNLFVSSHGYSPTISDQFNNPEYDPNRYAWAMNAGDVLSSTFTVAKDQVNVGRIVQPFTAASPNMVLFGGIYNMAAQMPGPSGLVTTDGAGAGTLVMDNVPFAAANTYNVGMYDPKLDRGIGRNVMTALDATAPLAQGVRTIAYGNLSFANAVPPARVETKTNEPGGAATAGASVEGVILSTGGAPIPHMGLNVKACVNGWQWNNWANTDENGRFQLYGLVQGTTYFLNVNGGCTWSQSSPGDCYAPYSSQQYNAQDVCLAAVGQQPVNPNDIVYVSTDIADNYRKVTLTVMPKSIGKIKVCVKTANGVAMPNSNVNLNPDGTPWQNFGGMGCATNNFNAFSSSPGFSNANVFTGADGCALVDGLPSGNYSVNVWTQFSSGQQSSFNAGPDGQFTSWGNNMGGGGNWQQAHCSAYGVDDYRVTIATANPDGSSKLPTDQTMYVYNSSGGVVNSPVVGVSSLTYIVTTGGNTSGEVKVTVRFPAVVDLANTPVNVSLFGQCDMSPSTGTPPSCPSGNFYSFTGSGNNSYTYTINVSSGFSYWMNVSGIGWGRVNRGGGNNNVDLRSTGTVIADMEFARAGAVTGTVYKPDGTILTPANNQNVWIDFDTDNGWTGTQLQKDGTFSVYDALPGPNRVHLSAGGGPGSSSFNYALPRPAPTLDVVAGSTNTLNLNLVKANYLSATADLSMVPDRTILGSGWNQTLGFKVIPLPAGTLFNGETISRLLTGGGEENGELRYSDITGPAMEGPCGSGWNPAGFCAAPMPSPSVYDLYLVRKGDFGDFGSTQPVTNNPYPHFVVISSSKNVVIDDAHAGALVRPAYSMSQSSGVLVDLTPAVNMSGDGNATLAGQVSAANFFRQGDYDGCAGDFEKFTQFLPVLSLYEANGAFKAAGIVVPPPDFIRQYDKEFNTSFAQGYTPFLNLLNSAPALGKPFGFEIRGLKPAACYTAVLTTPNYPAYQTRVCMGADKSTTTLAAINLDSAVGAGATFQGVVRTTNSVVLPGALVELSSEGMDDKSAVTNSSGAFLFQGLPSGTLQVKVSANGYARGKDELTLVGSNIYTQNYSLTAAAGVITGTVYSQKLPYAKMQAGAQIVAYDDTYNGLNPNAPLPLIKTRTGSDGTYKLTGLIPGDVYKVFLKVPGKYTLNTTTVAVAGVRSGIDFTMLPKPLDIEIFAKKTGTDYEFTVLNPQDYKDGWAGWSASPFNGVSASTVTMTKVSSGELVGRIPLSQLTAGVTYVLRGVAQSYSGKQVIRDLLFGTSFKGNAEQQIDDAILGDDSDDGTGRKLNEVAMDKTGGDPSGIMFPPGAVLPVSTAAIPTCSFKGEDKNDASVAGKVAALGADAFAGGLYTVALSSVTANENKSVELTLAYDKSTADLNDLSVARYNDATGKWESFSGVATVNPVKGTVKVKLKSLASVLSTRGGSGLQVNSFDGRQYNVRPSAAGSSTSGTFAVVKPSIAGNAYAGGKLKVFNYPNPFNLKDKAISNNQGAALPGNTAGTVIHVEVPAGNGGAGHIRIYNLAGELVIDLNTTFTAGTHNYVLWNGRNKGGQPVANGVYYGVVELSGKSPDRKDATFKMAVIK